MTVAIVVTIFVALWGWLAYEIYNAPTYGDDEMPIVKPKRDIIKRKFHIDNLNEGELYEELYRRNDEKEDVK